MSHRSFEEFYKMIPGVLGFPKRFLGGNMPAQQSARKQATYIDRLNILSSDIESIKKLIKDSIKNCILGWEKGIRIPKQTFHVIGPAGIGKTESCFQIVEELDKELKKPFNLILIKGPVLRRDDVLCPFPVPEENSFKMLFSDFTPRPDQKRGLFVIDEMGRADHDFQQLLWQLQNENRIHTWEMPQEWFVVSLDNPDEQEYSMNYFEDAAGLRRSCHLYCDLSVPAFLNYAKSKKFHDSVIGYITNNPGHLYDFDSQKIGMVYANPASWERVSNILKGYEVNDGISSNMQTIELAISGLLNASMSRLFLSYLVDMDNYLTIDDIINDYPNNKQKVLDCDYSKIGRLMESLLMHLRMEMPKLQKNEIMNIASFLVDIPSDVSAVYFSVLNEVKNSNKKAFDYLLKLQVEFIACNSDFKEKFYTKMFEVTQNSYSKF